MEPVKIILSEEDFSPGKKTIIIIFAVLLLGLGVWDLLGGLLTSNVEVRHVQLWLPTLLIIISLMLFFIAFHAKLQRKEHYFKIDDERIDYHYGLLGQRKGTIPWDKIQVIFINKSQKTITLHNKDHSFRDLNLNWVNRRKEAAIKLDMVKRARAKGIKVCAT